MTVKLLTENHLEFLSYKGGCTGWSEYTCQKATLLEIRCLGSRYIRAGYNMGVVLHVVVVYDCFSL